MSKVNRKQFLKKSFLALSSFVFVDAFWYERDFIEWTSFDISSDVQNKIKIIQISDLHLEDFTSVHKSIANNINRLKPDLIFFTGDIVAKTKHITLLGKLLALIDVSIKKFAVPGNWECWGHVDLAKLRGTYQKYNCDLLINQSQIISIRERKVGIIGVDDFVGGRANFKKSIKEFKSAETNIVLSHCPQYRDIVEQEKGTLKIDLVLAGHTHGGQINVFGFVPFTPPGSGKYLSGWYTAKEPKMYVSRGVGTSVVPFRFGSRAEIVEIKI